MQPIFTLSLLVFLPAISALVLACIPKCDESFARLWALVTAAVVFVYSVGLFATVTPFKTAQASMQSVFHVPWIPSFDIDYFMGIDGISLPLVILTTFVSLLAMAASTSKSITKHMKAYCVLFLLLETGMIGVFLALDFFLFYVFWEVMLLPMYFLIGIWGGPRREYAAIKFFLYTLLGSVLMLIAILLLYFNSDLTQLTESQLRECYVSEQAVQNAKAANEGQPVHTFNLLALMQIGQTTDCFSREMLLGLVPANLGVPAVVHRFRDQGAVGSPTHLAARCARRSAHPDLDDPGGSAAQDGRLRDHSHLLPDLPRRGLSAGLVRVRRRRGEYGLRSVCRFGAKRLQTVGRL